MARSLALLAALLAGPSLALAQSEPGGGYLLVLPPEGRPRAPELLEAVAPLLEHRRAGGLRARAVRAPADGDVRRRLRATIRARRPRYLLLVGDTAALPTWTVDEVATDRPYGDLDGDGYPEASIGRIPSSDPEAVARVVARTIGYERSPPAAPARKELALVAGEGGFGAAIDGVIEHLFQQIVAESVAPGYDVDLTYANPRSPFCYPAAGFADRVVERIDEGALVFAYVGHGAERSVDELTVPDPDGPGTRSYSVLDAERAADLREGGVPPVFVAIACWTGRLDGQRPSIGAELLAAPGGPVAFLGASRISHPVHNGLLARELVRELLADTGALRLGPALDRARRAMVEGPAGGAPDPVRAQVLTLGRAFAGRDAVERGMSRHVDMYNLFGDPALRLARPRERIALEAPERLRAGTSVEVAGRVALPAAESVTLTLEVPRDRMARPEPPPGETPRERYARANDRVLATEVASVDAEGRFRATFDLPRDLPPGACRWKAFAAAEGGACAIGARPGVLGAAEGARGEGRSEERAPAGREYY